MALKTIYGYKDVDFCFTPIEDADYSDTNVKQDYGIINSSYEKSNTILTKFLEVSRDIDDTLSNIGSTGISSSELDATFDRVRQSLHNADFQLEMSNKYFKKLVDQELAEIEAANKAAADALDQATGYGQKADTDHSKRAYDYIMSVPGFAEIFGQIQSTVEAGVEKVNNSVREFTDSVRKNVGRDTFATGGEKVDRPYTDSIGSKDYETTAIGLADPRVTAKPATSEPIKLDDYYETTAIGLADPSVTIKPAIGEPISLNPTNEIQAIGLADPSVTIKPATSVPISLNPTTETQAIGLANPNVTNKPTYNVIPEFYEKIQSGEYKVDPNIYIQKMDLPTGTASAKPISGVKLDTQAIGLANPSGDATTRRFQQEVLNLNSLQKSLDQDLAAFAKK